MRVSTVGLTTKDDGATAVEYAIMLALVIVATAAAIHAIGDTTSGLWANNTRKIQNAVQGR